MLGVYSTFQSQIYANFFQVQEKMKYLSVFLFIYSWRFVFSQTISNEISRQEKHKCSGMSEQVISRCLQPILDYASSIQDKSSSTHFSLQGGDIFKKLCTLYNNFKDCTSSIDCHSISMEAVEASYGYMCGAGYRLFEEHASCFAEVHSIFLFCLVEHKFVYLLPKKD